MIKVDLRACGAPACRIKSLRENHRTDDRVAVLLMLKKTDYCQGDGTDESL
jgi:hypothetical protein